VAHSYRLSLEVAQVVFQGAVVEAEFQAVVDSQAETVIG
jgi:hypothetical protein